MFCKKEEVEGGGVKEKRYKDTEQKGEGHICE